jgi:alkanesulfonate monooxygenase SsuD/methylene tetrahydromethanopterin reductase-like flavin-dependent oxidoreductase (luciferase family)
MGRLLFGLGISPAAAPGADPVGAARAAEELGFDFVGTNDHLHGSRPSFEPWTLLTWIAAATSRIRVATRVLATPLWPPPILRGMWSQERFSFSGRLYRTEGARIEPKPDHHIPIWLGTYGNRALAVTGRLADGWIPSLGFASPEQIPAMRDRVLAAARDAGRDPAEITCAYNLAIRVDKQARPEPNIVTGPPEAVVERLLGFVELGFTALNFIPTGPDPTGQAERLAREVVPAVCAAA